MLDNLPVLGICGWSGSGKTTLIEAVVPRLRERGLEVAVVKHDVHRVDVDRFGKDSDRFFRCGADVFLQGPEQELFRTHKSARHELAGALKSLARRYDLVLVEGHKDTPLQKVWLLGATESNVCPEKPRILATLPRYADRLGALMSMLDRWLPSQWVRTPVFGAVLLGRRHASPGARKGPFAEDQTIWLERTVELLRQVAQKVVLLGAGPAPSSLARHPHLPDAPEAEGPMAGLLSAMRWAPHASWLVAGGNLTEVSLEALHWLLTTRAPGVWATLPKFAGSSAVEPPLAHYDFRSCTLLEQLASHHDFLLAHVASNPKVISPSLASHLSLAWRKGKAEMTAISHLG